MTLASTLQEQLMRWLYSNDDYEQAAAMEYMRAQSTPEDSGIPALIESLSSAREHVQCRALAGLAELHAQQALPAIITLLRHDPSGQVRSTAAVTLGWLRNPDAIAPLSTQLQVEDKAYVCSNIIMALSQLNARTEAPTLLAYLKGCDDVTIQHAIVQSFRNWRTKAAIPAIAALSHHPDPGLQQLCVETLGFLRSPDAVAALLPRLQDDNSQIQRVAAIALGRQQHNAAVAPICTMLQEERGRNDKRAFTMSRSALIALLADMRATAAIPTLLACCKTTEAPYIRSSAIDALVRMRAQEVIPMLLRIVEAQSPPLDALGLKAASALGELDAVEAIPALLPHLHATANVIGTVGYALAQLQSHEAIPTLLNALQNLDHYSTGVIHALRILGAKEAIDTLATLIEAPTSVFHREASILALGALGAKEYASRIALSLSAETRLAKAALKSLGRLKAKTQLPAIETFLAHEQKQLRLEALYALIKIEEEDALPYLLQALDDPEWAVRDLAVRTLAMLPQPEAHEAVVQRLQDPHNYVRQSAQHIQRKQQLLYLFEQRHTHLEARLHRQRHFYEDALF